MKNLYRLRGLTDVFLKKPVKDIGKNSRDITSNYKYKKNIGLAFANNFGEEAREYFHIICKPNVKYNKDKCDKEYTGYLQVKDNKMSLDVFFDLYSTDLLRMMDEMVHEFKL